MNFLRSVRNLRAAGLAALLAAFAAAAGIFAPAPGGDASVLDSMQLDIAFIDADGIAPPGSEVEVRIRLSALVVPSDDGTLISDGCIASGATDSVTDSVEVTDPADPRVTGATGGSRGGCNASVNFRAARATLARGAIWDSNGDTQLRFGEFQDVDLYCPPAPVAPVTGDGETEIYCEVRTTNGNNLPKIVIDESFTEGEIVLSVQIGSAADGDETGAGEFYLKYDDGTTTRLEPGGERFSNSASIRVASIREVDSISLRLADAPTLDSYVARPAERVGLTLAILNENGRPANPSGIGSLIVTSRGGRLDSAFCGTGTNVCVISRTSLEDELERTGDASLTGAIPITWIGPDDAGAYPVWATVVTNIGDDLTTPEITLRIPGSAASIALAQPASPIYYKDVGDDRNDRGSNARDELTLRAIALDAAGGPTRMPVNPPIEILNPDGGRVSSTQIDRRIDCVDNARNNCALTIDVDDFTGVPEGEYTVRISSGSISVSRTFTVGGDPAALEVDWTPKGGTPIGSRITVSATVTDAAGRMIADGTAVSFNALSSGAAATAPVLYAGSGVQSANTEAGVASKVFTVAALNLALISVQVDDLSRIVTINTALTSAPAVPVCGYASLTSSQTGSSTWIGLPGCTASELLRQADGLDAAWLLTPSGWRGYAEAGGAALPGSVDFAITANAQLWLLNP